MLPRATACSQSGVFLLHLQIFPLIPAPGGENDVSYSECARKHLAFKPRKGDGRHKLQGLCVRQALGSEQCHDRTVASADCFCPLSPE